MPPRPGEPGNRDDVATAVAVDGSNNVIVTGYSVGNGSSYDCATIQYSGSGVPLWTNRYNGPANGADLCSGGEVDGSNNVIVTGYSTGSGGFYDYATIKYSGAGVPLWTSRLNGPGNRANLVVTPALAVDHSGNVIVAAYSSGSGSDSDFATIKYVFPLLITDIELTNGGIQMLVDNLQPGALVIETCTNLVDWAPVFTNTTPTNVLCWPDPDAGNAPTRFYRVSQFP